MVVLWLTLSENTFADRSPKQSSTVRRELRQVSGADTEFSCLGGFFDKTYTKEIILLVFKVLSPHCLRSRMSFTSRGRMRPANLSQLTVSEADMRSGTVISCAVDLKKAGAAMPRPVVSPFSAAQRFQIR
ncbi:MAG: hypothetical protein LPK02_04270 [Rhodobacterales bacterium]|nr:hypothetical protein [Rhodobacterales bacterium]